MKTGDAHPYWSSTTCRQPGGGYPNLSGHKSLAGSGFVDPDVLRALIAANSPLKAVDFEPDDAVVRR